MKKLLLFLSVLFVVSCSKDPIVYTLTTSANPADGGTVSPSTQQYDEGKTATITATPSSEYIFQSWSGATGSTNSTSVVMNSDKTVTANFVKKKYALTITVEGEGTVNEKVIKAGAATDYNSGTIVELTAVPSGEWLFVEWKGDATGTENPTQITIDKAKNVTAVFVKKQYPLTIEIEGEGTVTEKVIKAGAATDYNSGSIIELTAIPNGDWEFVEWSGDITSTENPTQITIDKAKTVTAVFVKKQYPLTIQIEGEGTVTEKVIKVGLATDYNSGTIVELTAEPTEDWEFVEWSGDITSTENPVQITIDDTKTVKAVFLEKSTLSVIFLDNNGVTIKAKVSAKVGMVGEINGVIYTVVDEAMLRKMVANEEDVTKVVTTRVTDMSEMFFIDSGTFSDFNQDISSWDLSNVDDINQMFLKAKFFNQDISNWNVSNVTSMYKVFGQAASFNQPIGNWDVSNVTQTQDMFQGATSFNQPIGNWDVSNVTLMHAMFYGATSFNQPIGNWDVSSVKNMYAMFLGANSFNQPIGNWNVANVEMMMKMFDSNTSFNQPIGNWDVSNVYDMKKMFNNATSFNQDLSSWSIDAVDECDSFGNGASSWTLPKPNFTNCNPD